MKILFVAFEFPPVGGGGVQRSINFARYLPHFGIEPVVVTSDLKSYQQIGDWPIDLDLFDALPEDLSVERIPCPALDNRSNDQVNAALREYFFPVESYLKPWKRELYSCLPDLIKRHAPQAIYVSLPPFGIGPLWQSLAKQLHLPLILDLRDAWSQWRISPYRSWLHYRLVLQLERTCLGAAAAVITTSAQTRHDLLRIHPEIPGDKIINITNGYDAKIADWSVARRDNSKTGPYTIGYAGQWYYTPEARDQMFDPWWRKKWHQMIQYTPSKQDWLYRSPYFFFRAVASLLEKKRILRSQLQIEFAGEKPDWIDSQIRQFGLQDIVIFHGFLTHPEVLAFQSQCDALLITSAKVIGGRDYSIAGKTFEYFTIGKPILAFVTDGAQKDILEKSGMALICNPDDWEGASAKVEDLINGKAAFNPDARFLKSLHRKELTSKLAEVIYSVVENRSRDKATVSASIR